jgi:hypothetical protein
MNEYLATRYGSPCRGCGYDWSIGEGEALAVVAELPDRVEALVAGHDGRERAAGLDWNVSAYVSHLADNQRIWADRLAGAALGSTAPVVPYDEAELAAARGYEGIALESALWSLRRSAGDWEAALALARDGDVGLRHPEQGDLPLGSVIRVLGHEALHHAWDVARIVGS